MKLLILMMTALMTAVLQVVPAFQVTALTGKYLAYNSKLISFILSTGFYFAVNNMNAIELPSPHYPDFRYGTFIEKYLFIQNFRN